MVVLTFSLQNYGQTDFLKKYALIWQLLHKSLMAGVSESFWIVHPNGVWPFLLRSYSAYTK
jgi:hypothetical protein